MAENQQEEDQRRRSGKRSRSIEEDERRRNEKSSRSIEETKERNVDLSLSKSVMRSNERRETESRSKAEKKDEEGQIRDKRDSSNQKEQRQSDVERQRRRYETESRMLREERDDRSPDLRRRNDERASDKGQSKSEWRYHKSSGRRFERLESGGYVVHPGKNDCFNYFQTGTCLVGSSCKFKHPSSLPPEHPEKANVLVCKYFPKGTCKNGSNCRFLHVMDNDGSEPMPQETPKTTDVPVCKFFLKGKCKKGSKCDFPHPMNSDDGAESMPQAKSMDPRASESKWEFDERIERRRYETDSLYLPPKKRLYEYNHPQPRTTPEVPENRFMAIQRERERREAQGDMQGSLSSFGNLRDLIIPISRAILLERVRALDNDRLKGEASPVRSSQQSTSPK